MKNIILIFCLFSSVAFSQIDVSGVWILSNNKLNSSEIFELNLNQLGSTVTGKLIIFSPSKNIDYRATFVGSIVKNSISLDGLMAVNNKTTTCYINGTLNGNKLVIKLTIVDNEGSSHSANEITFIRK